MLFVLPFDHRATFAKELLGFSYPRLTSAERKEVVVMKRVVFDGFLKARTTLSSSRTRGSSDELAILVDEEFGADILKEATKKKIPCALSTEKSGQQLFDFEYGKSFGGHITKYQPAYAKTLVRYNVANKKDNHTQNARLKTLSNFCQKTNIGFMLELLMSGNGSRFKQLKQTMQEMIAAGISPTVWKVEGMATRSQWEQLRGLTDAPIIILGRGDTKTHVEKLLAVAAKSNVVSGFAIGRTIWLTALQQFLKGEILRNTAVTQISNNFLHFIALWNQLTSKR